MAPSELDGEAETVGTPFYEVSLSQDLAAPRDLVAGPAQHPLSATRVDIVLSDGRRILIEGPTSLLAVVGLVQGLTP